RSAGGVHLAVDGRCDSLGYSAKCCTYSSYCNALHKIVHTEQAQVGERPGSRDKFRPSQQHSMGDRLHPPEPLKTGKTPCEAYWTPSMRP
ncbi:hypothetical protein HPB47_011845, partial [Ixodes persulcatus]